MNNFYLAGDFDALFDDDDENSVLYWSGFAHYIALDFAWPDYAHDYDVPRDGGDARQHLDFAALRTDQSPTYFQNLHQNEVLELDLSYFRRSFRYSHQNLRNYLKNCECESFCRDLKYDTNFSTRQ